MNSRLLLTKTRTLLRNALHSCRRFQSLDASSIRSIKAEELKSKGLLRISGAEVKPFLQGLTTNDINHLENGRTSIYSAFLNIKGRIIFETIIYKTEEDGTFLIECDSTGLSELQKHLKIFKVRKKIDIVDISDELKVWVVFNEENLPGKQSPDNLSKDDFSVDNFLVQSAGQRLSTIYKDPRLSALGVRVLVQSSTDFKTALDKSNITSSPNSSYCQLRYRLGVGEGAAELPPGKCFPHETNCDFLHGISFHKGCYIGQEVTSRTQHTGVVRKRLMPLTFSQDASGQCPFDTPVTDMDKDAVVGKMRGVESQYGLALLRISEALEAKRLETNGLPVNTCRPYWWPTEIPKEKHN